jgi:hypothetical protein
MFRSRRRKAPPWLIVAVGCLILLIGAAWLSWTVNFVLHAERTMGMITEMTKHAGMTHTTSGDGVVTHHTSQPVYRPIISFYDKSGQFRQVMESVGTSWKQWEVNQAVGILYAPDNPNSACIDSFVTVWMFPLFTVTMGVLFIIIGKASGRAEVAWPGNFI